MDEVPSPPMSSPLIRREFPFAFQVACFRVLQENLIHRLAAVPLPLKGKAYGVFPADRAYLEHND